MASKLEVRNWETIRDVHFQPKVTMKGHAILPFDYYWSLVKQREEIKTNWKYPQVLLWNRTYSWKKKTKK